MIDYSRPSVDVERHADGEWQWGVTHTVRPEILVPLLPGTEYSITVKVQRAAAPIDAATTLAALYARAAAIAGARSHAVVRGDRSVHHWVMCHAWRTLPTTGIGSLAFAMVMTGLLRPTAGQELPAGLRAPTPDELLASGGATMEEMQRCAPQRATEVFVEFDHRQIDADAAAPFMYAYGERVTADTVDSFEPFVRRAEHEARAHEASFDLPGTSATPAAITRHQWYMVDRLVTVELHLHAAR